MTNPLGSTWNKWDLHVHTPASMFHRYGANDAATWEKFIADLESLPPEFKVIGINDYIFVDGYEKVLAAKQTGRLSNIERIFPIVELRIDKFGGVVKKAEDGSYSHSDLSRVNLHVVFDELPPEVIRQQFLSAIAPTYQLIPERHDFQGKWNAVITRESLMQLGTMVSEAAPPEERARYGSPLQEGFNNLCVSLPVVEKALENHMLRSRHILAVGKAEWENIKWNDNSIAEKRNVINRVQLIFTAAPNPDAYHAGRKKLREANVQATLLDCSDAHSFSASQDKDRIGNCFTWIKSEPTFEGLKQVVTEFEQRVFIGDTPPKRLLVAANRTKYISSVKISKKPASTLAETWFDTEVPLNHDLVAIIGNKGSGKSALADVTALVGDTKNFKSFSFLRDSRFRDPRNNQAAHFCGELRWEDSNTSSKPLNEDPAPTSVERVKYLPQSYLEELCNELGGAGSTTFDAELRKIIYTHVPEEERLGYASLDELLDFKISELESEKNHIQKQLSKLNAEIAEIERKLTSDFKETLQLQLDAKKKELLALEGSKPQEVDDPQRSEAARREAEAAMAKIADLEARLNKLNQEEASIRQQKADALKRAALIARLVQAVRNQEKLFKQFATDLQPTLRELGISDIQALVSFKADTSVLEQEAALAKKRSDDLDGLLSNASDDGVSIKRSRLEAELQTARGQLGERERLFLVYKEQLVQWEKAKRDLVGDESKVNSIAWFKSEIKNLESLPLQRTGIQARRLETVKQLHGQIGRVVQEYRVLYEPVRRFVQSSDRAEMTLPLDFDVRVVEDGFQESFLEMINRQVRGSFAGIDESNLLIRRALQETDFSSADAVVAFVKKIEDLLHFDRRVDSSSAAQPSVVAQLRKGNKVEDLYDLLFGLSYLKPRYSLTYNDQEISQLSPGERGLLLLVFYLLVDKDDIPLVIDQPEENLDNQTIFKVLVRCIKSAKQRRQVIMVTHNPNLAVVCDAEQIIYAECDKVAKEFRYTSGAIETPEIRQHVIAILEGTEPAFVNRKKKYGF